MTASVIISNLAGKLVVIKTNILTATIHDHVIKNSPFNFFLGLSSSRGTMLPNFEKYCCLNPFTKRISALKYNVSTFISFFIQGVLFSVPNTNKLSRLKSNALFKIKRTCLSLRRKESNRFRCLLKKKKISFFTKVLLWRVEK